LRATKSSPAPEREEQFYRAAFSEIFAPRAPLTVSEWADGNRILSGKAAAEPGQWRTSRTPYLREPLDMLSAESDVEEVVMWFGTQLGKSESCNNWIGYSIDYNPGPVLLVQPTLNLAKRYSKQRIAPLIDSTPVLRGKVRQSRARDSGNTLLEKEFDGGIIVIAGANSAAALRSMPARDVLFDEIDSYPLSIDEEGDPISIAEKRQDTFARRKRLKTSTCTIKGESRIEQAYAASDRRRFFVPCPHCGERQVLKWAQVKWTDEDPSTTRYACEHCGALIPEQAKTMMLEGGEWRPEFPAARSRGYWLSSLYSPLGWLSWEAIVREFLDAKVASGAGDQTLLQVWTNTRMAETWQHKGERVEEGDVQKRAEPYKLRTVPQGVVVLTASVDVQADRLELAVWGWGRGEECWILDYRKLYGDPASTAVWLELDEILKTPLRNERGVDLRIAATAIDHGGHHSTHVEHFVRTRQGRHVIAVKGQSQPDKPVLAPPTERDTTWKGKKLKAGVRIWPVGSDTAKHLLYQRLAVETPGPGFVHTSNELDDEFYRGLTAEQFEVRISKGKRRRAWVLVKGRRNEPMDLWVYGYAAAVYLGMPLWPIARWEKLAAIAEPPQPEGESPAPQEAPKVDQGSGWAARPKAQGGFVKGWQ
jgi:phage terminase large subunit GpA-like protein